jgi:hypothetical protein
MSEEMAKSFCFVVVVVSCSSAQHSLFRIRSPANSQPRATTFQLGLAYAVHMDKFLFSAVQGTLCWKELS